MKNEKIVWEKKTLILEILKLELVDTRMNISI